MMHTYWQASRAPRYSLLFALPLLIFYQVLAALAPPGPGGMGVRNGADVILESVFVWLAGAWGPRLFMLCLIGMGAWLIARDVRANRGSRWPHRSAAGRSTAADGCCFHTAAAGPVDDAHVVPRCRHLRRAALPRRARGTTRVGRDQAAGLAPPRRWYRRDRARRADFLSLPLYRPLRR